MEVILRVGDSSGDGHGIVRTESFEINMSLKELSEAFLEGCRKLDITSYLCPYDKYRLNIFDEYGQRHVPQGFVDKLNKAGLVLEDYFYLEDDAPKGRGEVLSRYSSDTESFAMFWMSVAKIGNPNLEFTMIITKDISIGGYGLV